MDYSNLFVVLMGLGTVFAGLLCIILLVSLMSWVCTRTAGAQTPPKAAVPAAPAAAEAVSPGCYLHYHFLKDHHKHYR